MTIMLKNADYTTLEAIKNLQKMQKNLEIEIQEDKDFEFIRQKMRQKLDLPRNKAVFERLKDK
ncbi:hypothetical protein HPU229336_01525 [Helicobacter pullorum]|uniref:Uncharacterized protein n=1 Tax=Helicobacter pullorum TaxID=35818 RepID=A0AAW3J792_9HELI|nr:hypothetical protein [Helicobacter pullorum]KPH50601.1 hypothetical protein HPU229336_01525 [Helicobacter pullorum]OCR03581.1 hypothetical protein BA729_06100 [Helicobacter pullorum]OCR06538.1 hypothetical protein BA920_01175 [Helicobacter pullorum]OCR07406.1 hypothetical protein BA185_04200 [Helicobacter pullorum]OCR11334.1 hypothetical protein BA184_02640 [Helicobacter pullorum]